MPSLEKFPSFDAAAFERDQASSRREANTTDPFAPGGVFGDGELELPWRFPSPYAPVLPLGLDADRLPLELDDNARYAMGLPSHHDKDDHNKNDDNATTITPAAGHQERRPAGHDASLGTELPPYHTPLPSADDGGGWGPGWAAHNSLEVPKARDTSPLPFATFRQSDPFVEKDPPVRPRQQQPRLPRAPTLTTMPLARGLGPADARLFAVGGGDDPTPTRPAAASRAPTSAGHFAGDNDEPGPDVGPAARRRATPPNLHFAGFDGGGGGAEGRPPSSSSSIPPSPPLSVSPLSLGRAGSVATVRDLRAMVPPHRQISIRSLAPTAPPDLRDRPIIVTKALNHILYDGPCRHCEVNNCVCLLSSSAPSPQGAPATDDNPGTPFGTTALGPQQHAPPGNDIMTEGFCRHCVVNHCACVGDAKWGLHHAANARRNARLDEDHRHDRDTTIRRLVSDSGTVRRYESASTEPQDGDADRGSSRALRASGSASPPFAAPLPAYLPLGRERISSADHRGGFYDLEAQPRRDGSSGSGRGMVSTFHFRHSFRAGGAGQDSSLRGRRTRWSRFTSFIAGHLCRIFVAVVFILMIIVMAWVVWFYTNRDGVPMT